MMSQCVSCVDPNSSSHRRTVFRNKLPTPSPWQYHTKRLALLPLAYHPLLASHKPDLATLLAAVESLLHVSAT